MQRYVFKDSGAPRQKDADPQAYGEALEALRKPNGAIQADDVWRAARNPGHVMHGEFQWDERKAAEAHWKQRARSLINMVLVVSNDEGENRQPVQAYYSLKPGNNERRAYISSETVNNDAVLRARMHEMAIRELRDFDRRFRMIIAASQPLDAAMQEVLALLESSVQASFAPPPAASA